jgi:endonuclease/exonuclease/phosphatase family metal-dependent hydrolase
MATFVRKFTKRVFILANIFVVVFFLLACLNAFLNPVTWWWIAVLGLGFPYLLVLVIAFVVLWIIFRSKWVILSLVALLLAFPNIKALFGFHFSSSFTNEKDSGSIRILTWNVMWFDEQKKEDKTQKPRRKEMFEFIKSQNADILCFQEFLEANRNKKPNYSNIEEIKRLGYPYYYWAKDYEINWGVYHAGAAIFSKHPIVDSSRFQFKSLPKRRTAESLISASIDINGRILKIYTTHLQSFLLRKDDYRNIELIKNADDSIVEASKSLLRKLRSGYQSRAEQAQAVKSEISKDSIPSIICGDFNDVPNSFTYFTIKGDRQDAFIKKGFGIGRTYSNIAPTLRIDYILAGREFRVKQVKREILPYSDHYPVIADLEWKQ